MPMTTEKLIQKLEAADTDTKTFHALLAEAAAFLKTTDGNMAQRVYVSRPTFLRWRRGKNAPLPAMRKLVYKELIKIAKEKELASVL